MSINHDSISLANFKKVKHSLNEKSKMHRGWFGEFLVNKIIKNIFVLPNHPPLDAEHSLVYTINHNSSYYPVGNEISLPIKDQIKGLLIYIVIWSIIIFIYYKKTPIKPYLIGFISGLLIILLEGWFYQNISAIHVLVDPELPFVTNTPQVLDTAKGEIIKDPNNYIDWGTAGGDYKVILNNKKNNSEYGYIYKVSTYLDKITKGELIGQDFYGYLLGDPSYGKDEYSRAKPHARYNPGTQDDVPFFAERLNKLGSVGYYISLIVITWTIYISSTKWGSRLGLQWSILAFLIATASSAFVIDANDVVTYNRILFFRKRLLIIAISFAITAILIT